MDNNHNNIDDALKILSNRDKLKKYNEENAQALMMANSNRRSIEIVEKQINDSIGSEKKTSTSKKKKTNARINWKPIIFALIIALGIAFSPKIVDATQEIGDRIEFHREVNDIIDELKQDALIKLEMNGFNLDNLKHYDTEDFAKLNVSDPMEVYIFHEILKSEGFAFAEFMKSVRYEGVSTFYDFQHFLRYHGFKNSKTGEVSSIVFENMMEAEIKDTYEKYGPTAIITGIDEVLGNTQGRGAR